MRITFVTRKFGNVERNSHCDVLHITPVRVARLFLDCNGVFAIKAYGLTDGELEQQAAWTRLIGNNDHIIQKWGKNIEEQLAIPKK